MQLFHVYGGGIHYCVMADDARAARALVGTAVLRPLTITPDTRPSVADLEYTNAELTIRALRNMGGI